MNSTVDCDDWLRPTWLSVERIASIVLLWTMSTFVFDQYLEWRQYRRTKYAPPFEKADIHGICDKKEYEQSRAYAIDRRHVALVEAVLNQAVTLWILLGNGLVVLWQLSEAASLMCGLPTVGFWQDSMFLLVTAVISTLIDLPFKVYSTFVIEERYDMNRQTVAFFIKDRLKSFALSQTLTIVLMGVLVKLLDWGAGSRSSVFAAWGFFVIVTLAIQLLYQDFIAPLFDKYKPLPDGDLYRAISKLAESQSYPLHSILVQKTSDRAAHSNAYLIGFWKRKKIVLCDTLLEPGMTEGMFDDDKKEEETEDDKTDDSKEKKKPHKGCSIEEVVAVLAHELGHWKCWHVLQMTIMIHVIVLVYFACFGTLFNMCAVYEAFGFSGAPATLIKLTIVFQFILSPLMMVTGWLQVLFSRHNEHQADMFACGLGHAKRLADALAALVTQNKSFPLVDWLYSALHYTHPPALERIVYLLDYDSKRE